MKNKLEFLKTYFTKGEMLLWFSSMTVILISFFAFDSYGCLKPAASLIGVTSLIFIAKGNPFGQLLMIIFSIIYGIISFSFAYYGEMITYVGMTAPMAFFSMIEWLRHPYGNKKSEVSVQCINKKQVPLIFLITALVTLVFYYILKYFHTANIIPSTISVTTSFIAVYLTFLRSPLYAVGYAANDIVLIILWSMASITDISYLSVAVCFAVFLVNDIYGFISWSKMAKRQGAKL